MSLILFNNEKKEKFAENCIRLVEQLTDSEMETAIQRLGLEKEFFENLEDETGKIFTSWPSATASRPKQTRDLARLFIASNFIIYPGAKKLLRLSFENMRHFAHEPQTRKTAAAQLVWELRHAHGI
jgi:hypothetical protein